jgi:hypothetical protein
MSWTKASLLVTLFAFTLGWVFRAQDYHADAPMCSWFQDSNGDWFPHRIEKGWQPFDFYDYAFSLQFNPPQVKKK